MYRGMCTVYLPESREVPLSAKLKISEEVEKAIKDGYTDFIFGVRCGGTPTIYDMITEKKARYPFIRRILVFGLCYDVPADKLSSIRKYRKFDEVLFAVLNCPKEELLKEIDDFILDIISRKIFYRKDGTSAVVGSADF